MHKDPRARECGLDIWHTYPDIRYRNDSYSNDKKRLHEVSEEVRILYYYKSQGWTLGPW